MPGSEPVSPQRRRRAVAPEERGREADQTRERIIAAALAEFGAKGYAGARTAGIAARAGVNQQLIAYHFGSKQGLLEELRKRWSNLEREVRAKGESFADSVRGYLDATLDNRDWARLVIWQSLGDGPPRDETAAAQPAAGMDGSVLATAVERIGARQRAGELRADLDPKFILLLAYLLAFAPIALPAVVEGIYDLEPSSPDYRRTVLEQLVRVVEPST
ncbi:MULTISPECIES: TetR/AcrR family transcriptional regulator [Nocardia]|uniref:TetR/AcrR family transcriptional regulator n=1 Tax=Nocardia TaxID=1817 RepID=UPI000835CD7C|nr:MULTISPECIES: TetR family transcriptional regulator [Nocardia]MDE1675373.1 TetR family transcriptional regulator [Nocardia gipuzkoensis]